ncbi:hypothetical protein OAM69_05185 [bacterium]|nr:hypothetical protein [bacterium]
MENTHPLQDQFYLIIQAMLGVYSPNFRSVWVSIGKSVNIFIYLEKKSEDDLEWIEDFKDEYDALQVEHVPFKVSVIVEAGVISAPEQPNCIPIYHRRERDR